MEKTGWADEAARGSQPTIEETAHTYCEDKGDEPPRVFHPWRRFLARMLDVTIYGLLWSAFLAFVFHVNLANRSRLGSTFDTFVAIAMMLVLEPLWLHFFGTTPGKAILGLRIETPDGRNLSYGEGLERTWGVIGIGMGYHIPLYGLVRLWKSYKLSSEGESQPWDESISYTLKDTKWYRGLFYLGAFLTIFALAFTLMSVQILPPNRGDLTVADFVANYNYYADYFGIDFGNQYLDENATWAEKEVDEVIYFAIGYNEKPEFHFTTKDGYVTGLSFAVESRETLGWINPYDNQMILSSLAFAGAQSEIGLFSRSLRRIIEQIEGSAFEDFSFTEAGVTYTSNIEYYGYQGTAFLLPAENATETYFSLKFSLSKQKE